ncbi:RNA-directed DNA polymerase, eukaryota, reverse transcriptase zinc-binding domain protein [Tanacetum coccineum]
MPANNGSNHVKNRKGENRNNSCNFHKEKGVNGPSDSYAHAVKIGNQSVEVEAKNIPALVLDETCVNQQDLSLSLMGKVKEFASLSNLRMVLANEGFDNVVLKYMGGYWVMLEFQSEETKQMFQDNVGVSTWFSQLLHASTEFINDGRVTWVEIEGDPLKMWSENTFNRIASKWGVLLNVDDQEDEVLGWVPDFVEDNEEETDSDEDIMEGDLKEKVGGFSLGGDSDVERVFETKYKEELKQVNLEEVSVGKKDSNSEDPFNIYDLLKKKQGDNKESPYAEDSLKYTPSFTPTGATEGLSKKDDGSKKEDGECLQNIHVDEVVFGVKENCSNKSLKEDVAESACSGHFKKSKVPRIGGSILQLMEYLVKVGHTMGYNMEGCLKNMEEIIKSQGVNIDPRYFNKINVTVSDNFIMIRGVWVPSGEVVTIGDFNKVRIKSERFGSVFNVQGAEAFNMFISNAGLEETEAPVDDSNAMINVMKKLKYLKERIRVWINDKKKSSNNSNVLLKEELAELDVIIGEGEGTWIDSPSIVKNEFLSHFKNRFDKPQEKRIQCNMNFPHNITSDQKAELESEVTKEEIKRVVWDCGIDKSPGGNSSFIALIPKNPDANMVKDFRPISLIGSLYKIIAKILANRLVVVLGDIVNEVQSAFIANKQILDGTFILNELVQWCKAKKKQSLIFKADFEKSYDSVR